MSLNLEMLQVARLAPKLLGDSTPLVAEYLRGLINADGGFPDRSGRSDLYYTAFGIGGLVGLQQPLPVPVLRAYLASFDVGDRLDLVHLACLLRCWSMIPAATGESRPVDAWLQRIESHRSADGGYHAEPGAPRGTIYGCFLAMGAYQDCGRALPDPEGILACIDSLRCPDGGYANDTDLPMGLTPPSAAVAALRRHLQAPREPLLGEWLLARLHPAGGFAAAPAAPMPDLLSTATALHALVDLQVDLGRIREHCLDFIDSLWTARGGFHGTWDDDELDCEYTYYGLLALGHLSFA